jgi:hypothetical protein
MQPIKVPTIQRLKALKPGQKMTYYKGDFKKDIGRSRGKYKGLLEAIQRVTARLEGEGKIELSEMPARIRMENGWIYFTKYIATGKA